MVILENTESATSTGCGQMIGAKYLCNTLPFVMFCDYMKVTGLMG